mmetsp:Transcript_16414/g.33465  ORF Transcript_16414/g.33465 Transcript_16414/m.33465 type:complete len:108 (-) Transcript_16414:1915-2238(-)
MGSMAIDPRHCRRDSEFNHVMCETHNQRWMGFFESHEDRRRFQTSFGGLQSNIVIICAQATSLVASNSIIFPQQLTHKLALHGINRLDTSGDTSFCQGEEEVIWRCL